MKKLLRKSIKIEVCLRLMIFVIALAGVQSNFYAQEKVIEKKTIDETNPACPCLCQLRLNWLTRSI